MFALTLCYFFLQGIDLCFKDVIRLQCFHFSLHCPELLLCLSKFIFEATVLSSRCIELELEDVVVRMDLCPRIP